MTASFPGSPPIPRTRLIGRDDERASARAFLIDDGVPLLTLTGPGGVGKTRLALASARDSVTSFRDGAVWVDLSSSRDPSLVPNILAQALGLSAQDDATLDTQLIHTLRSCQLLLLLDNCEHLIDAVRRLVTTLLATCPAVQVLTTSRMPLHVRGEQVLPVEPLPVPPDAHHTHSTINDHAAVQLFVDRARAVHPAFAVTDANAKMVATLCRHLDGLPLAIELVAARSGTFSPAALLAQVTDRGHLLAAGPHDLPARQQTIAATMAWSYGLLAAPVQALFRQVCIFVGGFTLDAMQDVGGMRDAAGPDTIELFHTLVDHHLVRRVVAHEDHTEPRFAILETIREFGLQQLSLEGEVDDARQRHASYFLTLVDHLDAGVAPHVPHAERVLGRLDLEHPNLRAALAWLLEIGAFEAFVHLAGVLHAFWLHFGYVHEGRQWLEQAVTFTEGISASSRVWALVGLFAMLQNQQDDQEQALPFIEEAVALAQRSGDSLSIALACIYRGAAHVRAGELAQADRSARTSREAFAALPPVPWVERNLTHVDWVLSNYALLRGDISAAEALAQSVVTRQRELEQRHGSPYPYVNRPQVVLGHIARIRGDHATALASYQSALRDAEQASEVRGVVYALGGIAGTLAAVGRWQEAAQLFGALEVACERLGIGFAGYVFDWQRALGLPDPWQHADASFGMTAMLRGAVQTLPRPELPVIPDPASAAQHWSAGQSLPLDHVIRMGLAPDAATVEVPVGQEASTALVDDPFHLSPREREVLMLLGQRFSNGEIGERLFISPRTAASHVANICNKLGVSTRREAVAVAAQHGLVFSSIPPRIAPA